MKAAFVAVSLFASLASQAAVVCNTYSSHGIPESLMILEKENSSSLLVSSQRMTMEHLDASLDLFSAAAAMENILETNAQGSKVRTHIFQVKSWNYNFSEPDNLMITLNRPAGMTVGQIFAAHLVRTNNLPIAANLECLDVEIRL